jgi:uncharacterized SAM-binding protein YcdF (DUF218 family)
MKMMRKNMQGFGLIGLMIMVLCLGFIFYGFAISYRANSAAQDMVDGAKIIQDVKMSSIGQVKEASIAHLPENRYVQSVVENNDTIVLTYNDNVKKEVRGVRVDFTPLRNPDGKIVDWSCLVEGDPITSYNQRLQYFCKYL